LFLAIATPIALIFGRSKLVRWLGLSFQMRSASLVCPRRRCQATFVGNACAAAPRFDRRSRCARYLARRASAGGGAATLVENGGAPFASRSVDRRVLLPIERLKS
jgi:hypothetical protein